MKLLALDTATERCSVALLAAGTCFTRETVTPKGHAELILPMVDEVLGEAGLRLHDLDALAYGRGPGSFTGLRIAIGVVQGLAYGAGKPVVGVSNLAAVAQASPHSGEILVCMDARMGEVYWCTYERTDDALVQPSSVERLDRPDRVDVDATRLTAVSGTGFNAYPELATRYAGLAMYAQSLPHAREIAQLAAAEVGAGRTQTAMQAAPVYLRDQVVVVR